MSANAPENVRVSRGLFNERTWTKELPLLHYAMGAIFFVLAFINNVTDPDGLHHVVDFWVYYHASIIAHLSPEHIYNDAYYIYPLPRAEEVARVYPFINPPTFLTLLYPLGYFNSLTAVILWTAMNLALTFLLYRNISRLAQDIPVKAYRVILKSLVFGLYAWSWVIYNGQVSIILSFAISCFLLAWKEGRREKAMLWLALGLSIKPHYFIPVTLLFLGARHYRLVAIAGFSVVAFSLPGMVIGGPDIWLDFIRQVISHGKTDMFFVMVNLRGILLAYTPSFMAQTMVAFCSLLFALTALAALVAGHHYRQTSLPFTLESLCFWIIAAMYFCPWMHQHDFYLLLPMIVVLMPQILRSNRQFPLLISYSFVLVDFLVPGFSIVSNRITITFALLVTALVLHDLRIQRRA